MIFVNGAKKPEGFPPFTKITTAERSAEYGGAVSLIADEGRLQDGGRVFSDILSYTLDEVLAHYVADPDRVLDWLAHWLAQNGGNVRSRAALFRQSLRSGAPAPLAEADEQAAGVRYISGAYADYIQH